MSAAVDELPDQAAMTTRVGDRLSVDGAASIDPEGDVLANAWTLTPPGGAKAQLDDDTAARATFTPDRVGTWRAALVVTDALGRSSLAAVVLYDVPTAGPFSRRAVVEHAAGSRPAPHRPRAARRRQRRAAPGPASVAAECAASTTTPTASTTASLSTTTPRPRLRGAGHRAAAGGHVRRVGARLCRRRLARRRGGGGVAPRRRRAGAAVDAHPAGDLRGVPCR